MCMPTNCQLSHQTDILPTSNHNLGSGGKFSCLARFRWASSSGKLAELPDGFFTFFGCGGKVAKSRPSAKSAMSGESGPVSSLW